MVNNGAFFVSHRLPLAMHAMKLGVEVRLFTGYAGSPSMEKLADRQLEAKRVVHQRLSFHSAGINPLVEIYGLIRLIWVLRGYRADIVHCASPKGVLYGGIAARLTGAKAVVLAISGMGYTFTSSGKLNWTRLIFRQAYKVLAKLAFRHRNMRVIVQNKDDRQALISSTLVVNEQIVLIPGSGVCLSDFSECSPEKKERIVLLPARMLRDKGVTDFVAAAKSIRAFETGWRFLLAGAADYKNPSALSSKEIESWQEEGCIEWIGHVHDMRTLFAKAAIVCLPSYREGMPKSLLEAAAAGCAIVTTDVTGCREAIVNGETGDLVPVRNVEALAHALSELIRDRERRIKYGINGQKRAQELFSINAVVEKTFNVYEELLRHD